MRARASIVTAIAVAALAATAASAHAVPANIIAGSPGADPNLFTPPNYTHDAGTIATMTYAAGGSHNVTASGLGPDGKPLFSSATIGSGSAPVSGTQYLTQGNYLFVCTIHLGMNGALNVNSGSPLPRPTVAVKLASKSIAKVAKKGKANVKVTLTGTDQGTVTLKLGKLTLGTKAATKSGTLVIPISKAGKSVLAKKSKATLRIEAGVAFGSPVSATGKLK